MLLNSSKPSDINTPAWLLDLLGIERELDEGVGISVRGEKLIFRDGILRLQSLISDQQQQTETTFSYKWQKRETFESEASLRRMREWLNNRYGVASEFSWLTKTALPPLILDAGCGAAMSSMEFFGPIFDRIRYLGVDVSKAVDVAQGRLAACKSDAGFMQADITRLPLPPESVDVIFSEGVLHHTDSTRDAFLSLVPFLKPGGRFMFYVYRKKGPIREFTDDYIREKLHDMPPEKAWENMMAFTKLGKILGDLNIEIDIPEEITLLDVPAGRMNIQRLFYWHVFKAFYHPELDLEEMNHINFDWYAPANAHRQSEEEVRKWCDEAQMVIEREVVEPAGITVIARKLNTSGQR